MCVVWTVALAHEKWRPYVRRLRYLNEVGVSRAAAHSDREGQAPVAVNCDFAIFAAGARCSRKYEEMAVKPRVTFDSGEN